MKKKGSKLKKKSTKKVDDEEVKQDVSLTYFTQSNFESIGW